VSRELYVGLMSGTSLDGVDAVLVQFEGRKPRLLADAHLPFDDKLRRELLDLNAPGTNEIERSALAGNELAKTYAAAIAGLLAGAKTRAAEVRAIGCHGQTVRHRPERGYTTQLGNAALPRADRARRSRPPSMRRCSRTPLKIASRSILAASPT
jgi:anhydro-N-acetylmuramic acid kinase